MGKYIVVIGAIALVVLCVMALLGSKINGVFTEIFHIQVNETPVVDTSNPVIVSSIQEIAYLDTAAITLTKTIPAELNPFTLANNELLLEVVGKCLGRINMSGFDETMLSWDGENPVIVIPKGEKLCFVQSARVLDHDKSFVYRTYEWFTNDTELDDELQQAAREAGETYINQTASSLNLELQAELNAAVTITRILSALGYDENSISFIMPSHEAPTPIPTRATRLEWEVRITPTPNR